MKFKSYFLVGGAGFIGSHFVDALLKQTQTLKVTVYDNFSVGKISHLQKHKIDSRLSIIEADAKDLQTLKNSMKNHEAIFHFASNADIALAAKNPRIDFDEGFYLTHQVLEAARLNQCKRIIYTSGSGVYGDLGEKECYEHQGSLLPISTYGASKLAGEAYISSYCHLFGLTATIFRFGNVVGARQTHGVAYDFIHRLGKDPQQLKIMGDGLQSKSYIHVDDVIAAVFLANEKLENKFETYNVATGDYITVNEIAKIVMDQMNLSAVKLSYSGGARGWSGDIPIVRLNTDKIKKLGWQCKKTSAEAIAASVKSMLADMQLTLAYET